MTQTLAKKRTRFHFQSFILVNTLIMLVVIVIMLYPFLNTKYQEVLDADPKTRRLLCRTNPSDWNWEENPQYYSVYGWIDEEWVCANLLTTCP